MGRFGNPLLPRSYYFHDRLLQPTVFRISVFFGGGHRLFGLDSNLVHVATKITNYRNSSSLADGRSGSLEFLFFCKRRRLNVFSHQSVTWHLNAIHSSTSETTYGSGYHARVLRWWLLISSPPPCYRPLRFMSTTKGDLTNLQLLSASEDRVLQPQPDFGERRPCCDITDQIFRAFSSSFLSSDAKTSLQ
jgi:hypothetical protein